MDNLKLIEFNNLNKLDKFSCAAKIRFKDGTFMYSWFRCNKKEILSRNDEICKKILNDYKEFTKIRQKECDRGSINYTMLKKNMLLEFIAYPTSDKFDYEKKRFI